MNRTATVLTAPRLWLLALFSLVVLGALYRFSTVDDDGRHRVELAINELVALDIAANLEVLKLSHRHKLDYDGLVAASRRGDELLVQLGPEFARLGLGEALTPAREAWEEKKNGIERFKRLNSILSTSQFHFVNLAEDLGRRQDSPRFNRVSRGLLAFLMQGGNDDLPMIVSGIYQLDKEVNGWPEPLRVLGKMLVTHGALIVGQFREAQKVSRTITESPFSGTAFGAYRLYSEAHQQATETANRYRKAMAVFTLLLVVTVILALFRLRQSATALERSHRLLDNIADNLGEGILAFDGSGRLKFMNQRAATLIGRQEGELLGQSAGEVLVGKTVDSTAGTPYPLLQAIASGERFAGEDWIAAADPLPVAYIGAPLPVIPGEPDSGGYVLSFRDLSEVREAQARLHLAALVFDNLAEAMVITDSAGRIQSVNRAFTTITGFTEADARGLRPGDLLASGHHDPAFFTAMWGALRQNGHWQGEIINRRKSGECYTEWLSISALRDGDGQVVQYIGLFSDISDRKEAEAYIHHLAYHDSLTGLANRLLFRDRIDTALRQAQRSQRPLAVLMMDLDRFKMVNDTLGHQAGDHLLRLVANRLTTAVRQCDTLARLGGDEFALLMPEIRSANDAAEMARRFVEMLAPEIDLGVQEVFVTTSIGIAVFPEHGASSEQLLRNADVALYAAKNAGRNTWHVFDPDREISAGNRLELETALRHAIPRREMVLYYQLQVDARSGRISGAEALIRWRHPERGILSPDLFIPLAEQSGLIEEIGAWAVETACAQFAQWQAAGLPIPRIAINVSARELRVEGFTDRVMAAIHRAGIEPGRVELELTESMLSEDTARSFAIFSQLRHHGLRIAIDDFGTGYSSLNYLAQFPVDVLKIDRSFVRNLDGHSEASYLVRAIILLAQGMRMETVAEGVESEEQRALLESLGCDHLQGFLFADPQPPEALPALVARLQGSMAEAAPAEAV